MRSAVSLPAGGDDSSLSSLGGGSRGRNRSPPRRPADLPLQTRGRSPSRAQSGYTCEKCFESGYSCEECFESGYNWPECFRLPCKSTTTTASYAEVCHKCLLQPHLRVQLLEAGLFPLTLR